MGYNVKTAKESLEEIKKTGEAFIKIAEALKGRSPEECKRILGAAAVLLGVAEAKLDDHSLPQT